MTPFRINIVLDKNEILNPVIIQFVVALTTALMVFRFWMDAFRLRSRSDGMKVFLITLDSVTQAMIVYSLGIMQRPSGRNSYYQVWAVLLVTLRYSVKIGRPAGIALKQTPLVDLMSSFWAANILHSEAMKILKVTGWLLWSINSLRIIHGFLSSEFANDSHRENMRLLTEYMRHEHKQVCAEEQSGGSDPSTMSGYRYLVLGEAKKLKTTKKKEAGAEARDRDVAEKTESIRRLLISLKEGDKEMLTLEKIWNSDVVLEQDKKDLCLSFALYKLLRRRFFNLGIHEAKLRKTRRLVLNGILGHEQCDSERAFRVSEAELSFLNDFFNSRHGIIFARGFPFTRLMLSTLLVGGIAGMAYAVHVFSKVAKVDELGRVRHGVFFTWFLVSFLGAKEIWEIKTILSSDWTKILLLRKYVDKPWWFRGSVAKALVGRLCRLSVWPRWHTKVGQYNLLFPTSFLLRNRRRSTYFVELSKEVKHSVINCLGRCLGSHKLENYLEEAFKQTNATEIFHGEVKAAVQGVDDDVHILLVWHIATCYCEIDLAERRNVKADRTSTGKAFSQRKLADNVVSDLLWSRYMTARTLSQYCAYVLTLGKPLVPGNSLMARFVREKVNGEKFKLFGNKYDSYAPCASSTNILQRLTEYASGNIHLDDSEEGETILKKGADLGKKLTEMTSDDNEALWMFLSEFWSGFVIYLAASTKASQHKIYLNTGGELMTHLWALLSHAGILGEVQHGDQSFDTVQTQGPVYDPSTQT